MKKKFLFPKNINAVTAKFIPGINNMYIKYFFFFFAFLMDS
tara:strand:+ start:1131 stop:1253 length:123 start_codon:yes stop_codon:yes gene_type:complete